MLRRRARILALVLALPACAGTPDADVPCRRLVESAPAAWAETLPPVLALGPDAAPALERALRAQPHAPGRQAALSALGALGNRDAVPFLIEQLAAEGEDGHAYEAALSLGRLGDQRARPALRALADDPARDVTARTAAACALLDLGAAPEAVPVLAGVLLAGTPYGAQAAAALGLPEQSRWALERELCIDAIARHTGGETFGLHADSPWPRLAEGVEAFRAYMRR